MAKASFIQTLHQAKQRPLGLLIAAVLEMALAYVLLLWAFDNGELWTYALVIVLVVGALRNLWQLVTYGRR